MIRQLLKLQSACFTVQRRWFHGGGAPPRPPPRRGGGGGGGRTPAPVQEKSEWWAMDGEMQEIGEGVPRRERFDIPRDNLPNKKRKQMRDQFMRRTRLVIKDSEHEPWCRQYTELYQELRENWERLYWDEGYSKKMAQDRSSYDSADDDDLDFSPYRRRRSYGDQNQEQGFGGVKQDDSWERVNQVRDKFEFDRERRMRDKAFAPMNMTSNHDQENPSRRNQPFDAHSFFPQIRRD